MLNIPTGTIALWRNPVASIPHSWHLCDGTGGTPDLRDRFLVGAGLTYNRGDNGGSVNHNHTFTSDGHTHELEENNAIAEGSAYDIFTDEIQAIGTTNNSNHLPPYYALAYIQKT